MSFWCYCTHAGTGSLPAPASRQLLGRVRFASCSARGFGSACSPTGRWSPVRLRCNALASRQRPDGGGASVVIMG